MSFRGKGYMINRSEVDGALDLINGAMDGILGE